MRAGVWLVCGRVHLRVAEIVEPATHTAQIDARRSETRDWNANGAKGMTQRCGTEPHLSSFDPDCALDMPSNYVVHIDRESQRTQQDTYRFDNMYFT